MGAPLTDVGAEDSGSVYLFEHDGSDYVLRQKLNHPAALAQGSFGRKLAMDGPTLLVSAGRTPAFGGPAFEVFVFERVSGTWEPTSTLSPIGGITNGYFGLRGIAVSGSKAFVPDEAPGNSGVHHFENTGAGWAPVGVLARGLAPKALDAVGNTLWIGHQSGSGGCGQGQSTRVYESVTGSWEVTHEFQHVGGGSLAAGEEVVVATQFVPALLSVCFPILGLATVLEEADGAWSVSDSISGGSETPAGVFAENTFAFASDVAGKRIVVGNTDTSYLPNHYAYVYEVIGGEAFQVSFLEASLGEFSDVAFGHQGQVLIGVESHFPGGLVLITPAIGCTDELEVSPALVPNVLVGGSTVTLSGEDLSSVHHVRVGDTILGTDEITLVGSPTQIEFTMPLLDQLGEVPIEAMRTSGSSLGSVGITAPPAPVLAQSGDELAVSAPVALTLGGSPGEVALLWGSTGDDPFDLVAGLIELDIGGSGVLVALGGAVLSDSGWKQIVISQPPSIALTAHFQSAHYDPVNPTFPLPVSNVASVSWL